MDRDGSSIAVLHRLTAGEREIDATRADEKGGSMKGKQRETLTQDRPLMVLGPSAKL